MSGEVSLGAGLDFGADHFALFGLPRDFSINAAALDSSYRELQAKVHPDRFSQLPEAEKRVSMQWSTRANEAYQTLKKPLSRAIYLLELAGRDVQLEHNTAMPPAFLIEQMELREAVADARDGLDTDTLDGLRGSLLKQIKTQYADLELCFKAGGDLAVAAGLVRQLMFQEKLLNEIEDALEAIDV